MTVRLARTTRVSRRALLIAMTLTTALYAQDAAPSLEMLEYLGQLEIEDTGWFGPEDLPEDIKESAVVAGEASEEVSAAGADERPPAASAAKASSEVRHDHH